jgi:hypothetical protein
MPELLTPRQVALLLKIHPETLEQWRGRRVGPPWIKLGDKPQSPIRYRKEDIEKFLQDQMNK